MTLEILDDYREENRQPLTPVDTTERIFSMFLEYVVFCFTFYLAISILNLPTNVEFFFIIVLFLSKDIIGGKSLFKRLSDVKIVHIKTHQTPHPIRLVLRNFTCILHIIEGIVTIISPQKRRIGDYLCQTMVVRDDIPKHKTSLKEDLNTTNWLHVFLGLLVSSIPATIIALEGTI